MICHIQTVTITFPSLVYEEQEQKNKFYPIEISNVAANHVPAQVSSLSEKSDTLCFLISKIFLVLSVINFSVIGFLFKNYFCLGCNYVITSATSPIPLRDNCTFSLFSNLLSYSPHNFLKMTLKRFKSNKSRSLSEQVFHLATTSKLVFTHSLFLLS